MNCRTCHHPESEHGKWTEQPGIHAPGADRWGFIHTWPCCECSCTDYRPPSSLDGLVDQCLNGIRRVG